MIIYRYYCPGSPHQTQNSWCVLHDGPGLLGPGQMSLYSSHSSLTLTSPQPCLTHLSTLLSAGEDSASLCSLEPETVFKHEGLFRELDKHKMMKRKPLGSLSPKVSSTQMSSALNDKLICPDAPPGPEHGVGALRDCLEILVGRMEGSASPSWAPYSRRWKPL